MARRRKSITGPTDQTTSRPRFRKKPASANPISEPITQEALSSLRTVIGKQIQKHRILSEKTQFDLADKTGLSLKYVGEIERGEANIRLDTLERLIKGVGWDMAGALGQGTQSLNDGVRTLLRTQLEELGYYLDGVVRWLDALKPNQPPLTVTDSDVPAPPHLGSVPPRQKR